jgi:cytochrome c peroxidase
MDGSNESRRWLRVGLAATGILAIAPGANAADFVCANTATPSAYCLGESHFNDSKLPGLGANGRACSTCHVPDEAFQLSSKTAERRYRALLVARAQDASADDPLFRPIDANDFRTNRENARDYSNLRRGLIRVSIPLPANLRLIDPRSNLPSDEAVADVWRSVPSIFNVAISGADAVAPVWKLGPNANGGYQLDARMDTLQNQAVNALQTHLGARGMPGTDWFEEIAAFEGAQFSSAAVKSLAFAINSGGKTFPDPDPSLDALERNGKAVFKRACSACHGSEKHPSTSTASSPPLTQRYHPILSACPRPKQPWCSKLGCFTFPPCAAALERQARTYELTLKDRRTERITTTDPGRLLLSGDVIDTDSFDHSQGVFDIPQLHGISRTAPYFHNNSAATLEDVLTFYQAFFARREVLAPNSAFINPPFGPFAESEKAALLAYLTKL